MASNRITVLIVEDSSLVAHAFREMIDKQADMKACDTVECAEDFRRYVNEKPVPDVLLIDIYLPEKRGDRVEYYSQMDQRGLREGLKLKSHNSIVRVLFTSILIPEETIRTIDDSHHQGGLGFVHKNAHPEHVLFALREVALGRKFIDYATTQQLRSPNPTTSSRLRDIFSPREKDILTGISRGMTDAQIGDELGLAEKSVSFNLRGIRDKLKDRKITSGGSSEFSRVHLAHFAVQVGLTPPPEIEGFDDSRNDNVDTEY